MIVDKHFEDTTTTSSHYKKILFMVLFLYLIIVGFMVFFVHQYFGEIDGAEMVFGAKSIFSGLGYKGIPRDYWPPLYSLLIIPFFLLTGNWFIAGKVLSLISSIIFLYFSYNIIEQLFKERIALITIVLLILNPVFVLYSTLVEDHMLFSSLSIIGLYYFIKFTKNDLPSKYGDFIPLVIAGCFISLATLTRYPGYVFFLIIIIFLIFGDVFPNSDINLTLTRRLQMIIIFSSTFFLIQSPWMIINLVEKHDILYQTTY